MDFEEKHEYEGPVKKVPTKNPLGISFWHSKEKMPWFKAGELTIQTKTFTQWLSLQEKEEIVLEVMYHKGVHYLKPKTWQAPTSVQQTKTNLP